MDKYEAKVRCDKCHKMVLFADTVSFTLRWTEYYYCKPCDAAVAAKQK